MGNVNIILQSSQTNHLTLRLLKLLFVFLLEVKNNKSQLLCTDKYNVIQDTV